MPNYNNSIPFDSNLWSKSANVDKAVIFLAEEIKKTGKIKRWQERYTDHLRLIILNLYNNYLIDQAMYTAYSRNRNFYSKSQFYNVIELRYYSMVDMIDILWNDLGYIEGTKGFFYPGQDRTRNARMKATGKLLDLLFVKSGMKHEDITRNPDEKLIILKDDKKAKLEYEITPDIQDMLDKLTKINNRISKHFIGLCVTDKTLKKINDELIGKQDEDNYRQRIDFSKTRLKRIRERHCSIKRECHQRGPTGIRRGV